MDRVAIVGAGVAGLGAAYALRDSPIAVTVFERRDGPGGRAATLERDGCRIDTGANYLAPDDDRIESLVESLDTDGLVAVTDPVWTFDSEGSIAEGRGADGPRWTYRTGLATLGERLLGASDATPRWETPVTGLGRAEGDWWLETASGRHDPFDAVVLTPPAPRTATLLADADWHRPAREELRAGAASIPYRSVVSVALHYPFEVDRPYYGLLDVDAAHPVGWVGRESCKPGHVPAGESVLVAQMGAAWSAHNDDLPDGETVDRAAGHVAVLFEDARLDDPDWAGVVRWHDALPDAALAVDTGPAADAGLFLAGDWVGGAARLHRALASGLDAGDRLAGRFDRSGRHERCG